MALIILSGALANRPLNGGGAWVRISWMLGLKRLGHDVLFVEQIDISEELAGPQPACANAVAAKVHYFRDVMTQFGLENQAALIDSRGRRVWGPSAKEVEALTRQAIALINISGHLQWAALRELVPTKVYVDLDPGFTQFWHEQGNLGARLDGHDYYYTVGENIGAADCSVPTNGLLWRPIRQPLALNHFPMVESATPWRFTTVGSWRGAFGPVQVENKTYGQKVHEFRKFVELPRLVELPFEIALDIHPAEVKDLSLLRSNQWRLADPLAASGDPLRFRSYIQQSGAEFSPAQGMYVETNSGWFSDRTVRYLASGKPALVQDTGFSRNLPVGEGLLAFSSLEEAVAGAQAIAQDYRRHCQAARRIAERYFDSDAILANLLDEIGIAKSPQMSPRREKVRT